MSASERKRSRCDTTAWVSCTAPLTHAQQALLEHNAKVYMASRSKEKADAAIKDLQQQTGKEAIFLELDLSNLASVRKAAEEFMRCASLALWDG